MKVELLDHTPLDEFKKILSEGSPLNDILQHIAFTFAIEGISRVCSHQLVRHRVASFSQQSQRYVEVKRLMDNVVVPQSVLDKAPELFRDFMSQASDAYEKLVMQAVSKEDARFVLPNATETNLLVTMDGRELMHLFGLRCCYRAQWEIRAMADKMLRAIKPLDPVLFEKAGPYCLQLGYCPEGRFSCGRMQEAVLSYQSFRGD